MTRFPYGILYSLDGESIICVYGIEDIPRMTQIETRELAQVVCPLEPKAPSAAAMYAPEAAMLGAVFLAGLALGKVRRAPGR